MSTSPSIIGRYLIVERIGQGGMGALFLAWDPMLERQVAIKLLREADNDDLRARFTREARSVAKLRHPNIVTIFDVGEHEGQPFIAMEYIQGQTLGQIVQSGTPLSIVRKLEILAELCSGLGYAHKAGIIHRDIKPANLMLDSDNVLKVLDFGIARLAESGMTQAGMLIGTLNYMSPEQVTGQQVDARSDIFAVGAVGYELLTRRQAFAGGLHDGILNRILSEQPTPIEQIQPGLDEEVVQIITRAMAKRADERYQDLASMRKDLLRVHRRLEATMATSVQSGETTILPAPYTPRPQRRTDPEELRRRRLQQIEDHFASAERAFASGDFEAAISSCEQMMMLDPQDSRGFALAERCRQSLDQRQAHRWLDDAQEQLRRGALASAMNLVQQALSLTPDSRSALDLRDAIDRRQAEREQERKRAEALQAALDRAAVALASRDLENAVRAAEQALAIDPAAEAAHDIKAQAMMRIEERNRAAAEEAERAEKAERERKAREAAEIAERERKAREAAELAEKERRAREAAERAEQERQARAAAALAEKERQAREAADRAEQERQARAAAALAEKERQAREAAELAEKERKAREAAERAEKERQAREAAELAEKAERERIAREKAERERQAREAAAVAEKERKAAQKAEKDRKAREAAENAERAEKAEAQRAEAQRAEKGRRAREQAEQAAAADHTVLIARETPEWTTPVPVEQPQPILPATVGARPVAGGVKPVHYLAAAAIVALLIGGYWVTSDREPPPDAPVADATPPAASPEAPAVSAPPPPPTAPAIDAAPAPPSVGGTTAGEEVAALRTRAQTQISRGATLDALATVNAALKLQPDDAETGRLKTELLRDAKTRLTTNRTRATASGATESSAIFKVARQRENEAQRFEKSGQIDNAVRAVVTASGLYLKAADEAAARSAAPASAATTPASPATSPGTPAPVDVKPSATESAPPPPPPTETRTAPEPPRVPETRAPVDTRAADESAIRAVLRAYEQAYRSLDSAAVQRIYPSVDAGTLRKSFEGSRAQDVQIRNEQIEIAGATATVRAQVAQSYTPRAGRTLNNEVASTFVLQKSGGAWVIVSRK